MKIHDHVSSHHSFMYVWILGAVLVFGGLIYSYIGSHPNGVIDGQHEGDVRTTVAQFGNQLNTVSLLSPNAAGDIEKVYKPYVTEELLASWIVNPLSAPGRMTSSPWPDHIEADTVTMNEDGSYTVLGRIMLKTATGDAGIIPITLTVTDVNGSFLISAFVQNPLAEEPEPEVTSQTVVVALNESVTAFGVTLTPKSVEDSRCPSDVQCIHAGTVKAKVQVASGMGESDMEFSLHTPVTTEAETIILTEVFPYPVASEPTKDAQYRFTFTVQKR